MRNLRVSPPEWTVEETGWAPTRSPAWESICTLANGYLGVRGFPEETEPGVSTLPGIYLAGVFEPGADGIPELVNITNFLQVEIRFGGEPFRPTKDTVTGFRRALDLRRGLLARSVAYSSNGKSTRIDFERFVSVTEQSLVGQSIQVVPLDWSGEVFVRFWLGTDPNQVEPRHIRILRNRHVGDGRLLIATETLESRTRIAHGCSCSVWVRQTAPPPPQTSGSGSQVGTVFRTHLECGQRAVFDRLTTTHVARHEDGKEPEHRCMDTLARPIVQTYGTCRRRHVRGWDRRWRRSDIRIEGPEDDQRALRFAIFHLIQSCPRSHDRESIGAKGLTGPGYRGHVFWDTEIFMLPFFVHTDPVAGRRLLRYRCHTLPGARRKAREAGYRGAMFAWESADTGDETCPRTVTDARTGEQVRVLCGEQEQHITADVVYAAWSYVRNTGDSEFRDREFLQLCVESARFWANRVQYNATTGQYEINGVIGPDEYHEDVNNNAYTNFMAAWNLDVAAREAERARQRPRSRFVRELGTSEDEIAEWSSIADGLLLPNGGNPGLWEQHEGFLSLKPIDPSSLSSLVSRGSEKQRMERIHRSQVLKQPDVLMLMMLFPDRFSARTKHTNWRFYEPRTTHDSSLSPCIHSIVASQLGLSRKAYGYFRRSAFIDLHDGMRNTHLGLHCAALGGTWQAVVRGFLGLRTDSDRPTVRPRLPHRWSKIGMRLVHRGRWYSIEAHGGGEARVEPDDTPVPKREQARPHSVTSGAAQQ